MAIVASTLVLKMRGYGQCQFGWMESKLEEFEADAIANENVTISHHKRLSPGTPQDNPVTVGPVIPVPCTCLETIVK